MVDKVKNQNDSNLQHAALHHASLVASWREMAAGGSGGTGQLPESFKLYQDATKRVVQVRGFEGFGFAREETQNCSVI